MSGTQQRKKAQGSKAVSQARGGVSGSKQTIAIVLGILVLAVVVIGGALWTNQSKEQSPAAPGVAQGAPIPAVNAPSPGPERIVGSGVEVGKPEAKKSLDLYEDFMCPACGQLEARYGQKISDAISSGQLKVTFHMLPMLSRNSNPPGYSENAANAAMAAAESGKFYAFHKSLYAKQPEEGGAGYDKAQLARLGKDLGITSPGFEGAVNGGKYVPQLNGDMQKIAQDPVLAPGGSFGTPTMASGGKKLELDPTWLDKLLSSP